jgi:UDP-2,3-diacylglucosamine pyrophosphatase LpxH
MQPHFVLNKGEAKMSYLSRRTFLELAGASVLCGCGGSSDTNSNDFSVLAFSDLHFNPLYDPDPVLINKLIAADPSQWASIFETSKITTLSPFASDTNYPLLVLALESIKKNLGASTMILYTGDLLGHGISYWLGQYTGITDAAVIQQFSTNTASFVMQQIRAAAGKTPVFFAVGNCDSYTGYGPDSVFLSETADFYYSKMLNGSGDHQAFLTSFEAGGYYSVEPAGTNIMAICLNTIAFSPSVQNADGSESNADAVDTQLAWFDTRLAAAKAAKKKVWLLMHAPPGADEGTTAKSVQANGHLPSSTMMWEPNYQASFMQIISKYSGLISMTLAGHTHMDEYRIMSTGNVLEIVPGLSPVFGNDPAYKIFQVDRLTYAPADYSSVHCDLNTSPHVFSDYYTYSDAYPLKGSLGNSLESLFPALVTDQAKQNLYRGYYYSGNGAASPITNTNWPVYWGGIGNMWALDLTNAVNSY